MIYDEEKRQKVIDALREGDINRRERERKEKDASDTLKENPIDEEESEENKDTPSRQEDSLDDEVVTQAEPITLDNVDEALNNIEKSM